MIGPNVLSYQVSHFENQWLIALWIKGFCRPFASYWVILGAAPHPGPVSFRTPPPMPFIQHLCLHGLVRTFKIFCKVVIFISAMCHWDQNLFTQMAKLFCCKRASLFVSCVCILFQKEEEEKENSEWSQIEMRKKDSFIQSRPRVVYSPPRGNDPELIRVMR